MQKLSDKELYGLCCKYGANARFWSKKFASLLPEVESRQLWRQYGFYSIEEFSAKLAGMNHETVRRILTLNKKLEDKPFLKAQIETQGWSKLNVVANIATPETDKFWAEKVALLPKKALEIYVTEKRPDSVPGDGAESVKEWSKLSFKVKPEVEFRLRKFQQKLEREKGETVSFGEVLEVLLKKVEEVVKPPREQRSESEAIPSAILSSSSEGNSRYLSVEKKHEVDNGGKCGYPGCNKPHCVYHHPERYEIAKNHDKIVPLCTEHHQIAHAGLIEGEHDDADLWSLRDEAKMNWVDRAYQKKMWMG